MALLLAFFNFQFSIFNPACGQHEGHDHSHGHDHGVAEEVKEEAKVTTAENSSAKYEVLLKFLPVEPGEELEMTLFISHFKTNEPLDSADIQIINADLATQKFELHKDAPGTWHMHTTMPEENVYNLDVIIKSPQGDDYISLPDVDFSHKHSEEAGEPEHSHVWMYFAGAGSLLLGFLIGRMGRRRITKRGALTVIVLCMIPASQIKLANAQHDGHSHGPTPSSSKSLSKEFEVPKETQFLMGIRTVVAGEGEFSNGRRIYGTVIPATDGHAVVNAPQTGKLVSLSVKPGDMVSKGQTLAMLERSLDAASDINYLAEKNKIEAEFEAARREHERLKSLSDIAAGKELDEAEARFNTAKTNRELFNSGAKVISLKAPISGTLAPFAWSSGSSVNAEQIIFTITNLDRVYVEAQAYEPDVHAILDAQHFEMQCVEENHRTSDVKLLSLGQEFNSSNQSQKVLFEMNNSAGDFKLGEFVNVWVYQKPEAAALAIPNSSFTEIEGRQVVFVKKSAEYYELRYVALGENNGTTTIITNGIVAGERIVSEGAYQVKLVYLNQ